jgi:hypothetical protein
MKPQIFNHLLLVHLSYDAGRFPKRIRLIYVKYFTGQSKVLRHAGLDPASRKPTS